MHQLDVRPQEGWVAFRLQVRDRRKGGPIDALSARLLRRGGDRFPTGETLENAIRILDRGHVAIVILDHLDRGAHLLREKIDVNPLCQAEGGVSMPEAVGAAPTTG